MVTDPLPTLPATPVAFSTNQESLQAFEEKYASLCPETETATSGAERVKTIFRGFRQYFKSQDPDADIVVSSMTAPWEVGKVMETVGFAAGAGAFYGATVYNHKIIQDYKRKHAHYTFVGKYDARTKLTDYTMLLSLKNGGKMAWRCASFAGILSTLSMCSIAYHDAIKPVEMAAICGLTCALWRLKGGLKAAGASGLIGLFFGSFYALSLKVGEYLEGTTVSEWRRQEATEYLRSQVKESRDRDKMIMSHESTSAPYFRKALFRDERLQQSESESKEELFPLTFRGDDDKTKKDKA